jgi:predicted ATPase
MGMPAGMVLTAGEASGLAGRDRELGELRDLARDGGLVTLVGAAGTGKTRLLKALLPVLADEFPDGIFRVDLADLRRPDLVPARVASVLGVWEEPGVPLADTMAGVLHGRRAVLALDGCEQLAGACADLAQLLLASAPELLIIAASPQALGAAGETVWPVPPLALPAPGERDPVRAARSGAVRLFADRAGAARPGFVLADGNCPAVAAICRAAGGLPLAIELAAARIGDLDAARLADRLGAWPGLPGPGEPAGPARDSATVRAIVAWSHSLLEPGEQALLRRLSVLASWSMEIAERICADGGLPAARIAGLMARLAGWSLVELRPGDADRYRMPGAVRELAAGCLAEAGEAAAVYRRLRDYATNLADYISSIGTVRVPVTWPVLTEVFSTYEAQAGNIRAVLDQCLEDGDTEGGLRICAAVRLCWDVRGGVSEGIRWLDAFLGGSLAGVPAEVRGPALVARAQLALSIGELRQAESLASAGLDLCLTADDLRPAAAAIEVLAQTALRTGRPEEALRRAAENLELTGRSRDWWSRGFAIGSMSSGFAAMGRIAEAREWAEAGLALMTEIDHHWGAALFRIGLGDLARRAGDLDAARESYLAVLPLVRDVMPAPETARCLGRLGSTAIAQGDPGAARGYLAESLQFSLAAGHRTGIARTLLLFADLAALESRPDRAVILAAAATALRQKVRPSSPSDRAQRHLDLAGGRGLGADEAARLWAEGLRLTSQEAARLALQPPA